MSRIIFTTVFGLGLLSAGAASAQSNSMAPANTMAPAGTTAPASTMAPTSTMAPGNSMAPAGGTTKPDAGKKNTMMGNNAMSHNTMAPAAASTQ